MIKKIPFILAIEIGERDLAYQLIKSKKLDPVESNINFAFLVADEIIASKILNFMEKTTLGPILVKFYQNSLFSS